MAEVKWIKISTEIFDNRKIKQIEALPDGDSIIVIWVKLLCLAGQINDCGLIYFTKEIPYTEQMLAQHFNRPLTTIQMALNTFQQFGMIELIDNVVHISNWEKYQNVDGMEKIREQTRKRVAKHRESKKLLLGNVTGNVTVTDSNATDIDIDKELDKELDIDTDIDTLSETKQERTDYNGIVNAYNEMCPSLPRVKTLSDSRKRAIKSMVKKYGVEHIVEAFKIAESSDFLTAKKDGSTWKANFDWIMKDTNMAKILDGNYDNSLNEKPKEKIDDILALFDN